MAVAQTPAVMRSLTALDAASSLLFNARVLALCEVRVKERLVIRVLWKEVNDRSTSLVGEKFVHVVKRHHHCSSVKDLIESPRRDLAPQGEPLHRLFLNTLSDPRDQRGDGQIVWNL